MLQASVLSHGGEIFMLEMGEPVRILELAQRMIRLSGHDDGHRDPHRHDRLAARARSSHEELHSPDEEVFPTAHPFIRRLVPVTAPRGAVAEGLLALREAMARRDADARAGPCSSPWPTPDRSPAAGPRSGRRRPRPVSA